MSKVKIEGHGTGTGTFTVTTPSSNTDRTITLPDSTGTLATTDDNGSQLDHSGSKKIEATSTGASVTGVGKFFLENNGGAGGGIVASNTDASNPATGGFLDLMERDVNFGTANNYGVRLYYDGNVNKFHIQGGNQTTVATHLTMERDSGDITIDTGDLIFGTAGKGIVLGSTSNTDSNTLDDYEEGTFTVTLSAVGGQSASNTCRYTKIGNMVTVDLSWNTTQPFWNVQGSTDAAVTITSNLPFTPLGTGSFVSGITRSIKVSGKTENDSQISIGWQHNQAAMYLGDGRGNTYWVNNNVVKQNTQSYVVIQGSFSYMTS